MEQITPRALVTDYLTTASGADKTRSLMERFVSSPELIDHVLALEGAFPRYELEILDVVAEGDRVACRLLFHGVHHGDFQGLEPTGREATMSVFAFYEVAKGRISDAWILADGADLVEQLTEE